MSIQERNKKLIDSIWDVTELKRIGDLKIDIARRILLDRMKSLDVELCQK